MFEERKFMLLGSYLYSLLPFRGDLLESFRREGFSVFASAAESDESIERELRRRSVLYCQVKLRRDSLNPLHDAVTLLGYLRMVCRVKPEVVLSYTIKPIIYGSIAAALFRVPIRVALVTGLGSGFSESASPVKKFVLKLMYKLALRCCHLVFFQNEADLDFFVSEAVVCRDKCFRVMGSGVKISDYAVEEYPSQITFTMVSRLLMEKGVLEFLEAAKRLKCRYPDVRFKLVGWIDDESKCISKRYLNDFVEKGFVEYVGKTDQIKSVLADTSVFVLPSYYKEGVPRTLLEALAASRPVVTTNNPGCADTVIDGWNGYLVPPRDIGALETALERFILDSDKIRQMGACSKSFAHSTFDVELVNKEMVTRICKAGKPVCS